MTFLNPLALWGLGAIALLVIFSLWRLKPRRQTEPSIRLWQKIVDRRP